MQIFDCVAGRLPSSLHCSRANCSLSDYSFTNLFIKYVLSACCGSGTVLGTRGTAVNKTSEVRGVLEFSSPGEEDRTKESID